MPRKFSKDANNEQLKWTNPDKQLPEHCTDNNSKNIRSKDVKADSCIEPSLYMYNIGDATMGGAASSNVYSNKQVDGGNMWKNLSNEPRSSKRSKRYFGKSNKKEIFNNINTSNRFDVLKSYDNDSMVDMEMKDSPIKNMKKNVDSQSTLVNSVLGTLSQLDSNVSTSVYRNSGSCSMNSEPNLMQSLESNNSPSTSQTPNKNVSSRSDSEVRSPNLEAFNRPKKSHKWEMGGKKTKQKHNDSINENKSIILKKSILKKEIDEFENNDMILPFDYSSGDDEIKTNKTSNSIENYVSDTSKMFHVPSTTMSTLYDTHRKAKKNVRFKSEVVIIYYSTESIQAVQNGSFIASTVEPLKLALQQQQRNRELRNKHAYARTMFPTSFSFGAF